MPANWLSNSSDVPRRMTDAMEGAFRSLAQPARARRLRQSLLVLFTLWALLALSRFIWTLLPAGDAALPEDAVIINPVSLPAVSGSTEPVNIERLQGWHLFGEAGAAPDLATTQSQFQPAAAETVRAGIEKGARETRLDLKLRGVVASTDDGLGYAIIEHKSRQEIYAVEDKLPVSGKVVLAKVMPSQVVLDNGGTYELLQLFEDSSLDAQLDSPPPRRAPAASRPASGNDAGPDAAAIARDYRERLYQDPQSLAEVVTVSAVRENGVLLGYRIAPGAELEQFEQLGFRPGDLVTSVNGIELNDPANTLLLYQTMRSASEVVFDLQRNDQQLTVSVNLGNGPAQQ